MEELQHLAGKIEEIKEKLTDGEYKELLDLAKECYDKKEEKTKKKFMKVMCIKSEMYLDMNAKTSAGDCNCENCQEEDHFETIDLLDQQTSSGLCYEYDDEADEYHGDIKKFRLKGKVKQTNQVILFEVTTRDVINGFWIDMKNCKMTHRAYDELLKDKSTIAEGPHTNPTSFVYLSHFEI